MTTGSEKGLNPRQERTIIAVIESRTVEEACAKAGISKTIYYRWLHEKPAFAAALKSRRDASCAEALERLSGSMTAAVDVLVSLLQSGSENVRRAVASDIISRFLKARELGELEERLVRVESRMGERG